jgi:hypothetical protein
MIEQSSLKVCEIQSTLRSNAVEIVECNFSQASSSSFQAKVRLMLDAAKIQSFSFKM